MVFLSNSSRAMHVKLNQGTNAPIVLKLSMFQWSQHIISWRFFVGIPGCFYNDAWTGIRGSRVIPILEKLLMDRKEDPPSPFFMYLEPYLVAVEFLILEGDNLNQLFPSMGFNNAGFKVGGKQCFVLFAALNIIIIPLCFSYKTRFLASLPASRRASAAFTRPMFIAVAFYLCGKKHKLKVDKLKLIELCGASETEFSSVSTSLKDLCFDVCGTEKEKKDPKDVKGNGESATLEMKTTECNCLMPLNLQPSSYKRHKKIEKHAYEGWKTSVLISYKETKAKGLNAFPFRLFHSVPIMHIEMEKPN
ncbi:hypothetical protein DVH24_007174 [Malus domestica]|uniref:ORC6 second cyclin-like domain-containing protein n=1 Tax=Malus domestica TaxID=3750 RepID=A0A498HEM3_MALDO|nr:hypothetical protein DVH24_007174 [Malus domestica]